MYIACRTSWGKCISAHELRLNSSNSFAIAIQKSKIGELASHVKESGLSGYLGVSEGEAVERVKEIVDRVNVAGFQPHWYTQIKVEGSVSPAIFVKVFP